MNKLSFRPKALEITKPLTVYRNEELPDLPEYSAINRAVPQLPSGMDKEEECGVHDIHNHQCLACFATTHLMGQGLLQEFLPFLSILYSLDPMLAEASRFLESFTAPSLQCSFGLSTVLNPIVLSAIILLGVLCSLILATCPVLLSLPVLRSKSNVQFSPTFTRL